MKFKVLLEDLLTELSGEEIYKKYYSKIPYDIYSLIVGADPQTKILDNQIQKAGKFSKFLLDMYQKGNLKLEDLDKAKEYLQYVYKHKISLYTEKINDLSDVYNLIKQYIIEEKRTLEEILKALSTDEYDLLLNGEKWIIYHPKTEKAACYLGYNTEWCTTWGPYSLNKNHRDRSNRFQYYSGSGPLYIMISKNDPNHKFQFHFETNQYMDVNDRQINTKTFLKDEDNIEIFNFFFPSFFGDATPAQREIEFKRIDLLPEEYQTKLLEVYVKDTENNLVLAITQKNEELLSQLISSDQLENEPEIENNKLVFYVDDLDDDVQQHYDTVSYYESESSNGWEWVNNDLHDRGMDEYMEDYLLEYFKGYYESNKNILLQELGITNFELFEKEYFENYKENKDIVDAFFTDITDLSYQSYEDNNRVAVEDEKKYLDIDYGYTIGVSIPHLVKFLLVKKINQIDDDGPWTLNETLNSYINYYRLTTEFEPRYDYEQVFPKYGDRLYTERETDKYFDSLMSNPEMSKKCVELRKEFNKIKDKYFRNSSTYENDFLRIRLLDNNIDCQKETVKISYFNKKDGDEWKNSKKGVVRLDNLVTMMTNYKLFESIKKQLLSLSSL